MEYVVYIHTDLIPHFPEMGQQYGLIICQLRSLAANPQQSAHFRYTDTLGNHVCIKVVWQYALTYIVDINRRCIRVIGLERTIPQSR